MYIFGKLVWIGILKEYKMKHRFQYWLYIFTFESHCLRFGRLLG